MKATELIIKLQEAIEKHGDQEVLTYDYDCFNGFNDLYSPIKSVNIIESDETEEGEQMPGFIFREF